MRGKRVRRPLGISRSSASGCPPRRRARELPPPSMSRFVVSQRVTASSHLGPRGRDFRNRRRAVVSPSPASLLLRTSTSVHARLLLTRRATLIPTDREVL